MFKRFLATTLTLMLLSNGGALFAAGKTAPAGKVNINTATVEQLVELPGIGPSLAARIVEHRSTSGRFSIPQELMKVKGIGEKSFERLRSYLTVGDGSKQPAGQ